MCLHTLLECRSQLLHSPDPNDVCCSACNRSTLDTALHSVCSSFAYFSCPVQYGKGGAPAGVMFITQTEGTFECLEKMVFAMPHQKWPLVDRMAEGTTVFLCDTTSQVHPYYCSYHIYNHMEYFSRGVTYTEV